MSVIRKATAEDAGALAILAERSFRDTFEADNSLADINSYCLENFNETLQRKEIQDPNYLNLVADNAGELIAFTQIRLYSPKELIAAENPAELYRLYVSGNWHGQGIAHKIMSALFKEPSLKQTDALWLSVWEHNPRAIAFYRKYHFEIVGDHIFQVGSDPQRDLVMSANISG